MTHENGGPESATSDGRRVNIDDESDVRYWTAKFGCNRDQLRAAVAKVGDLVLAVEKELLTSS